MNEPAVPEIDPGEQPLFWASLEGGDERWGVGVPPFTVDTDVPASTLNPDSLEMLTRAYGTTADDLLTVRRYSDGVVMYTVCRSLL